MSTPPTPIEKARRRTHDTGFPEPFNDDYNTTLPHPDADLSPNAVISSDSLSAEHFMKRRRLSMLSKHRRTMSQNSTTSQGIHSILPLVANIIPGGSDVMVSSPTSLSAQEGTGSVESIKEELEDDTPHTSLEMHDPEPEQKRKSFIGKLRAKSKA